MAKLQLLLNDAVLEEFLLVQPRMSIGRRSHNDIKLESLAVSGEHAILERVGPNFFIQDCDSTNGTLVNGKKVRHKALHDGDTIGIAKYTLRFWSKDAHDAYPTTIMLPEHQNIPSDEPDTIPDGLFRILDGKHQGKELQLTRDMTTLGRSGQQLIVIVRRETGYFLTQLEGSTPLQINQGAMNTWPHRLRPGDELRLLDASVRFEYRG